MGKKLASNTSALLLRLAEDCDRIQSVIGDLITVPGRSSIAADLMALDHETMRDLQGLDRIAQLMRDVAAVQGAWAESITGHDDPQAARHIHVALLEETRLALSADQNLEIVPPQQSGSGAANHGDCDFF